MELFEWPPAHLEVTMDLRTGCSLWQDLQASIPVYPPFEGDAQAEVVIIGGGVTGALLSWILVQHGIDVSACG